MRRCGLAALGASLLTLLALAASASAAIPFCPPGAGAGQCNSPRGLATDWETGHVYVVDRGNGRVNVFDSDGTFLSSFGSAQLTSPTWVAVDNDPTSPSHHDVYVAADDFEVQKFKASGEFVDSFGGEGEGACQLMRTTDPIAVGPGGVVNVADSFDKDGAGELHVFVNRVQQFDSEGKCVGEVKLFEGNNESLAALAVDSLGNFYVIVDGNGNGVIRKYGPTGALIKEMGGTETQGLAVNASDNVFGKQRGEALTRPASTFFIAEYAPDTSLLKRFSYTAGSGARPVLGLAALDGGGPEGVFATEGTAGVNFLEIPKGPVIVPEPCHVKNGVPGSVRATIQAEVNPEGKATSVKVEYSKGGETKTTTPEALGGAADFELHEATVVLQGLTPETTYTCRVIAENAEGTTLPGEEGSFETKEGFQFGGASVTEVGEEEVTLNAAGNALGLPATAEIEYVTDAQYQAAQPGNRFAEALTAPETLDYGAGETMQLRSLTLTGLAPATTYHWRLRVKNGAPPQGIVCPRNKEEPCPANEHVFRTYGTEERADERGWELVSPGQKNSAEVATPALATGVYEDRISLILASSSSGEAATYTSFTSFGKDAEGSPSASQYLSKRTASGWATQNISPFGFQSPILSPPFRGFTPELGFAVFKVTQGVLAPGCPEGVENLYLRDNASGTLTCLTQEVPEPGAFGCFNYGGSSEDGSRAFFTSTASYAGVPAGEGLSLYEWTAQGGLQPISVLPGQSAPAVPTERTVFGPNLGFSGQPHADTITNCQFGQSVIRHAVSADGSKVFWTYGPSAADPTQLLARIDNTETIQLDAEPKDQKKEDPGPGPFGNGVFQAASKDGSIVYFTAPGRLIAGSKAEKGKPDLYRYDFNKAEPLSDLTKSTTVPADVQGVVGASDDGSHVYFVAKGVLSEEEEGPTGQKALEGAFNLYLYNGAKASFIARLSNEDMDDWAAQPKNLSARVTPDGKHLAFLSIEAQALAGYDNTIAEGPHCKYKKGVGIFGGPLCAMGFIYDAEADTLTCATCNPTGSRPLGPATLPRWSNPFEGPRYLSDDGSRFFFESFDALLQADENEKLDVYEFERPGTGSCATERGTYDPASGGCHFLVSTGKSEDHSYLVDASSDGRDVFFSSRQALVGWDTNENFDVYDYREGGGFPEPAERQVCLGEACKAPPAAVAPTASPPEFIGPGNPKAKKPKPRHKKHARHKKKHRKAKKKPHSHKAKHGKGQKKPHSQKRGARR